VGLNAKGATVYDVFARRPVTMQKSRVDCDLRLLPARLYAILPRPIAGLSLSVPRQIAAGQTCRWAVTIRGPRGPLPLCLRLLDAGGALIEERHVGKPTGTFIVPVNAGRALTLEVTELISGQTARRTIQVTKAGQETVHMPAMTGPGDRRGTPPPAIESLFGPHLRDIAVLADGTTA